jgi:hypothetical protein
MPRGVVSDLVTLVEILDRRADAGEDQLVAGDAEGRST